MGDVNHDPSMEDILASIKRVIAEDGRVGLRSRAAPPAMTLSEGPADPPSDEDVLELDDPVREGEGIMSADAAVASRQSLATLAAMREPVSEDSAAASATPTAADAPLEAVVREMLRPMLKDWLDQRLPEIVEQLVTREIARITGKSL